jgi:glycosyltransferase involved in cell wall biosynthesis
MSIAAEPGSATPRVSLIVCTTGSGARLAPLFTRLISVLDADAAVEVLIVDNSRPGGLTSPDARIRVVRSVVSGLSRARTTGCMHARGDVLVFTDDDVDFDAHWPATLAKPVLEGRLDAAAATVRLGDEYAGLSSTLLREWLAEANIDERVRLVGAGMAIHRRLLGIGSWDERLGAGRPDFAFGEETLFEYMIRAAGARLGVVADAPVVHHPDLDRISDDRWRSTARQKGLSAAYLEHHWWGTSLPAARLRLWWRRLRLPRMRRAGLEQELRLRESIGNAEGHLRLRGEPPLYVSSRRDADAGSTVASVDASE